MRYRIFGRRTRLRVSELALGAGNFGTRWGHGAERGEAKKVFDRYVEVGGNFIDTADSHQFGESEELVDDFIASDRDYFVLATKYTLGTTANDDISRTGNSRKNMVRSVEGSLKRLKTDRIDLYWAHFADDVKPSSEQSARLDAARTAPLGTPHEQINGSAARIAGGKPELLEPPLIPVA
jgi:aryl-alcohol dehydrogenase-like predicted oxidoreductase